jgi:ADP-L-glycero-D-manno-heptose 6-epimerase
MMIVVTGGAGFIGSALVAELNASGRTDILIVDALRNGEKWKNLVGKQYVDFVHKERFLEQLEDGAYPDVDCIVHLGACSATTQADADYLMDNNFHYSRQLCEWAQWSGARFIYASSAATYGAGERGYSDADAVTPTLRPLNMYGYSKQLMDEYVLRNDLQEKVVGLKFFNVFGPNEYHKGDMCSVVYKAYHQILQSGRVQLFKSRKPEYADGGQMRDFVYVKDCVAMMVWLIQHPEVNGIFNMGTGTARTWEDLVHAVFAAMERPAQIEFVDLPEHLHGKYQYFTQAGMAKFSHTGCPLQFRSLEDAVKDYVQNYLMRPVPYY